MTRNPSVNVGMTFHGWGERRPVLLRKIAHEHRVAHVAQGRYGQLGDLVLQRQLPVGKCRRLAIGQFRPHKSPVKEGAEQLVGLALDGSERFVAELVLADSHRHVAVVGQADAGLLGAEIHDHDAQLHAGDGLLLGTKTLGQLVAGKLDPGAQPRVSWPRAMAPSRSRHWDWP